MSIFSIELFWLQIAPSYYGLMYVFWFFGWYFLLKLRKKWVLWAFFSQKNSLDDLLLYIFVWVIFGWRLWYVLFYNFSYYINNIIDILKVWEWGMSFHGGALWVVIALFLFARSKKISFYDVSDEVCSVLPIGLFFGRIWNYINKELLWFPYNGFLSVQKNGVGYFPSPLLEAFLEWIVLFIILYFVRRHKTFSWQVWSMFLIWYWAFRLIVEIFFRLPDAHIWYIYSWFSVGALLSVFMILIWVVCYMFLYKNKKSMMIK